MPDDEPWEHGKRKIRNDAKDAVKVAEGDNNVHADAASLARLVPVVRNRMALEKGDEEEGNASHHGQHGGHVYGPGVDAFCDDSKEEPGE